MEQLRGTALKRFVRRWQRENKHSVELAFVLQSVSYPVNVGSIFRIADAVNATEILLCGATPTPPHPAIAKVGRDKQSVVPWRYFHNVEDALADLRVGEFHICALELTTASVPYYDAIYPSKVALVLGNEDHGVTRSTLEIVDSAIFVPMYGKGRSLNVHVTAAIAAFYIIHQDKLV